MTLSGFIDPNSKEAKAKEIKISSTNGNGENVAIVLDDDNSKQDRPNYDKQYYALHRKLILEKKKNTINNRMLKQHNAEYHKHTMKPIRKNWIGRVEIIIGRNQAKEIGRIYSVTSVVN